MKRHQSYILKAVLPTAAALVMLFFTACSKQTGLQPTVQNNPYDPTQQYDQYGNPITAQGTFQNPYNPTVQSGSPTLPGSLFSTAAPQQVAQPAYNAPTASFQQCLQGTNIASSGCTQSTANFSNEVALQSVGNSFGQMNYCYQAVIQQAAQIFGATLPNTGTTASPTTYYYGGGATDQNTVNSMFQQGGLALVQCYQQIVQNQASVAQWQQQQQTAYQSQQQRLQMLLYYLAQGGGGTSGSIVAPPR